LTTRTFSRRAVAARIEDAISRAWRITMSESDTLGWAAWPAKHDIITEGGIRPFVPA